MQNSQSWILAIPLWPTGGSAAHSLGSPAPTSSLRSCLLNSAQVVKFASSRMFCDFRLFVRFFANACDDVWWMSLCIKLHFVCASSCWGFGTRSSRLCLYHLSWVTVCLSTTLSPPERGQAVQGPPVGVHPPLLPPRPTRAETRQAWRREPEPRPPQVWLLPSQKTDVHLLGGQTWLLHL